jgi:hypothetical protein
MDNARPARMSGSSSSSGFGTSGASCANVAPTRTTYPM